MNRRVQIKNRPKTINECIYYNVDAVHEATNSGKKIRFKYFDYNTDKEKVYRKNGGFYIQTPTSLCWNDDNYYLITYNSKYDDSVHFRVDRMSDVEISLEDADPVDAERFNVVENGKKVFGMYGGKSVNARLSFDDKHVNVVLDHFGKDTIIVKGEGKFRVSVEIIDSPVFLAWMFQFGKSAEIIEPVELRDSMKKLIEENLNLYS